MHKKFSVLFVIGLASLIAVQCSSTRNIAAAKTTYDGALKSVVSANCSPCHFPAEGGKKKAYDNIDNLKADIDEIIRRIELQPGERGFMPFRGEARLSDSTIMVFKKWKEDGMLTN